MEMKLFKLFFVLLFLLASQEMVVPGEARVCLSPSHKFHGTCVRGHNCAEICRTEGFSGGDCHGFRRRCMCSRRC
ncbi:defensin-like protein 1 [Tripterygium wilfordii]|uniref:defensin-like protein 1 n=1 Tax=Tripterygium wilfordii TaxID=458696 RepID=UPI0018F862B9|nr:defensin-like protein 1 [Tripterygium wilfordii]XP_038705357.1 defensin-like protein 1 [Tripterygium wilfordii]